jgi:hypothetical protein
MDPIVQQMSAGEIDTLTTFLREGFRVDANAPAASRELMRWKYFDRRTDWNGSRSYVSKVGEDVLAHVGVCPMPIRYAKRTIAAIHVVDWLSVTAGAGRQLLRKLLAGLDAGVAVGGSPGARLALSRMRFHVVGRVSHFVRPLRPWQRFRADAGTHLKAMARLSRDLLHSRVPLYPVSRAWSCEAVSCFEAEHEQMLEGCSERSFAQVNRSVDLLNYFLRCPAAFMAAHVARYRGAAVGYFILARLGAESRLVDLRLTSEHASEWATVVSLACRAASRDRQAHWFMVSSSLPLLDAAARANRFRLGSTDPVWLMDVTGQLADRPALHITPADGDQAYL